MAQQPGKLTNYFNLEEEYYEDMLRKRKREEGISRAEKPEYEKEEAERVLVRKREAMPKLENEKIQVLDLKTPEIIGSLFDRVKFLRERVAELEDCVKLREQVHREIGEDINLDKKDKEDMARRVADINEKRNLMLDISVLRREKRLEDVQFWRDMVELKHELREMLEQYQTELKIVQIFEGMGKERAERLATPSV